MYWEIDSKNSSAHGLPYSPFKSIIVPRPIGWISSLSAGGVPNLAPFSFFTCISEHPPMLIVGVNGPHPKGGIKDTLTNVRETGEFVANLATYDLRDALVRTSHGFDSDVDEMEAAGLASAESRKVKPRRVAASPAALECEVYQILDLPSTEKHVNTAIFGRVVGIYIDDAVIVDGMVDVTLFKPLARLGYRQYSAVDSVFNMARD